MRWRTNWPKYLIRNLKKDHDVAQTDGPRSSDERNFPKLRPTNIQRHSFQRLETLYAVISTSGQQGEITLRSGVVLAVKHVTACQKKMDSKQEISSSKSSKWVSPLLSFTLLQINSHPHKRIFILVFASFFCSHYYFNSCNSALETHQAPCQLNPLNLMERVSVRETREEREKKRNRVEKTVHRFLLITQQE